MPGTDFAYLGGDQPTSMDFDDKYIALGYGTANGGYGKVEVRLRSTLGVAYSAAGDGAHRNLGRDVALCKKVLQPGGIEAHYVHYSSMKYESERVSFFAMGLITLVETDKTITKVSSKPQIETDADGNPVIDEDG